MALSCTLAAGEATGQHNPSKTRKRKSLCLSYMFMTNGQTRDLSIDKEELESPESFTHSDLFFCRGRQDILLSQQKTHQVGITEYKVNGARFPHLGWEVMKPLSYTKAERGCWRPAGRAAFQPPALGSVDDSAPAAEAGLEMQCETWGRPQVPLSPTHICFLLFVCFKISREQ